MGDLSQLLAEIAHAPAEGDSWREPLKAGDVVGRYQIRQEIGRGGFGAVYEAFDPQLGRVVALKALKPGRSKHPVSEEWIQKEAEAVAKLDHPAIVTIHDVGTCPAGAYLVMELLRGETLARRIEQGPLLVDEALRIAEQMAEGLSHAHSRGVLHRDLKPANVFVCEDGRVKLLDFGLAHLLGTEGSSGAGTPAYMAPEQAAGAAVDERADVWAAGMVLGEMLTGKRPVERTPTPAVEADRTELMWEAPKEPVSPGTPPALTRVPRPIAKAVGAALSEDPAARPRDGGSWLSKLRSARRRVERPKRIRRIAIFATAFVLVGLAVAGLATWRIWERQVPGGRPTVAVADFANETGDPELDSISELLITSLEQGTQLRVLTRGRMLDVLKQLGKPDVPRIDEPLAREVGREARASALLLASIRKLGTAYVVEMRALDPLLDEYVFTVSERATGKEAVFDIVDRLGSTTRAKLGRSAAVETAPRIATITTSDPRAWDLFVKSREASADVRWGEARKHAEAALEIDPEFALAHYQLAFITVWTTTEPSRAPSEEARGRLEAAEARAGRLPERERLFLRMWRAHFEWRLTEARDLADQAAAAYPLDKEAVLYSGHIRLLLGDPAAGAILERVLQLDPGYPLARNLLFDFVSGFGIVEPHLARIRAIAAASSAHLPLVWSAQALLMEDLEAEGIAALERALVAGAGAPPYAVQVRYLVSRGRAPEAESLARSAIAQHEMGGPPPKNWPNHYLMLVHALAAQGRLMEARGVIAELETKAAKQSVKFQKDSDRIRLEQALSVAARSPGGVLAAVRIPASGEPSDGTVAPATTVHFLAFAGDVDGAGRLAAAMAKSLGVDWARGCTLPYRWDGAPRRCRALALLGEGRIGEAEQELRAVAEEAWLLSRFAAPLLLGEIARQRGDCATAVTWLEKARASKSDLEELTIRAFVDPGLLHSLAVCHEKLGDLAKARERNAEFLRLWANADPDIPLLAQAKAMQARLASAR